MIKEGSCLQDLKLLARSQLQEKGTAFNFAEVDLDQSMMIDVTRLVLQCMAPQSIAIFWYDAVEYEPVKAIIRTSGFTVDSEPSIWYKGQDKSRSTYHSGYRPFLIGYNEKRPWWHRETKRCNVFYYPETMPIYNLKLDILATLCRPRVQGRVLIPNARNSSTVLACKHLSHDFMAWGSMEARMDAEQKWEEVKKLKEKAAIRATP